MFAWFDDLSSVDGSGPMIQMNRRGARGKPVTPKPKINLESKRQSKLFIPVVGRPTTTHSRQKVSKSFGGGLQNMFKLGTEPKMPQTPRSPFNNNDTPKAPRSKKRFSIKNFEDQDEKYLKKTTNDVYKRINGYRGMDYNDDIKRLNQINELPIPLEEKSDTIDRISKSIKVTRRSSSKNKLSDNVHKAIARSSSQQTDFNYEDMSERSSKSKSSLISGIHVKGHSTLLNSSHRIAIKDRPSTSLIPIVPKMTTFSSSRLKLKKS